MVAGEQSYAQSRPRDTFAAGIAFVLLISLVAGVLFCGWVFVKRMERLYRHHIFPNVYALGVDIGGKTPTQAAASLREIVPYLDTGVLVLRDGDQQWTYPWSSAGLSVDIEAMVEDAYAQGRGPT